MTENISPQQGLCTALSNISAKVSKELTSIGGNNENGQLCMLLLDGVPGFQHCLGV